RAERGGVGKPEAAGDAARRCGERVSIIGGGRASARSVAASRLNPGFPIRFECIEREGFSFPNPDLFANPGGGNVSIGQTIDAQVLDKTGFLIHV
ncbi:hypothetical protein, partial [Burkholderia sp. RF4-BP95]|uniref:hypothetical protein n=1 Tax=Burkholderia sp. RF4-BP95 TaxID=1637845 RepID=UPI001C54E90E